ncbi:ECF transporter S component [Alkaliphilus crotonatoxidans]
MQKVEGTYGITKNKLSTSSLVKISILAVMGYLLMAMDFPLPIFPGFLKIDLSDVPALVGGFALGPMAGVLIQLVKVFLHFITKTQTGGVGELANFIIGVSYVLPATLIYHLKKDKLHALMGVFAGTVAMCAVGVLANLYLLIPFYANFMPFEGIISMGTAVNRHIVDLKTLVIYGITPFNLFKGLLIALVTSLIYKRISPLLRR